MTFKKCKTLIAAGRYEREDMLEKLDTFLLHGRISREEYNTLVELMTP